MDKTKRKVFIEKVSSFKLKEHFINLRVQQFLSKLFIKKSDAPQDEKDVEVFELCIKKNALIILRLTIDIGTEESVVLNAFKDCIKDYITKHTEFVDE